MKLFGKFVALACGAMIATSCANKGLETELLIIGGGASGTAAGIQAARMDVNSIIVEESPWLGGMLTSAGVSCIDGNSRMPSGFSVNLETVLQHFMAAMTIYAPTGWPITLSNPQLATPCFTAWSRGKKIISRLSTVHDSSI